MTKAEKEVQKALRNLNKAFWELYKERGMEYNGRYSACRIPHVDGKTYFNIFGEEPDFVDYTYFKKEKVK